MAVWVVALGDMWQGTSLVGLFNGAGEAQAWVDGVGYKGGWDLVEVTPPTAAVAPSGAGSVLVLGEPGEGLS